MESLKAMLAKKKGEVGTSFSRSEQQKKRVQLFKQEQQKRELEKQKKLQQKLKQIDQFCQPKKAKKMEDISDKIYQGLNKESQDKNKQAPEQTTQIQVRGRQKQQISQNEGPQPQPINDQIFKKKIKDQQQYEQLEGRLRYLLIEPKLMDQQSYRTKKLKMLESNKQKDFSMGDKCEQILLWCKKILKVWAEALEHRYNNQEKKNSRAWREAFALYRESCLNLEPFFAVLRVKNGDVDMLESIYHIMNCSLLRDYRQANDRYIQMSIGNAPWPMGSIMLGITVRRNTPRLAHVLKDPVSRRWTQSIKRLLTVSQELYPNQDKTKMVLYSVASIFG